MDPAPATIRPSLPLDAVGNRFTRDADSLLVTTPDGFLLGVLLRTDVERRLDQAAGAARPR